MNLGINNNYQYGTNFGCNRIKIDRRGLQDAKSIVDSLKHEMPEHLPTVSSKTGGISDAVIPGRSAVEFYQNMGFKPHETLPNGAKIYFPTSLKEMEEVIAKDAK